MKTMIYRDICLGVRYVGARTPPESTRRVPPLLNGLASRNVERVLPTCLRTWLAQSVNLPRKRRVLIQNFFDGRN